MQRKIILVSFQKLFLSLLSIVPIIHYPLRHRRHKSGSLVATLFVNVGKHRIGDEIPDGLPRLYPFPDI